MCGSIQLCARVRARLRVLDDRKMEFENDFSLKEWAKDKPLSILQLDPADRAVLRIAGLYNYLYFCRQMKIALPTFHRQFT